MADLQFGVNLYPHQWRDAARIEELGYDSVWTSEHVFFYFPTFDALTTLAAVAALTSRIRLGTAVLLLPLRPAALAAQEITSVDDTPRGRLTLGIGVGGEYPKEFQAVGVPVGERGARTDEAIQVLRRLWTEENVTFEGRFTKLDGVTLQPKPAQRGGPPLWIAGRSEAATLPPPVTPAVRGHRRPLRGDGDRRGLRPPPGRLRGGRGAPLLAGPHHGRVH